MRFDLRVSIVNVAMRIQQRRAGKTRTQAGQDRLGGVERVLIESRRKAADTFSERHASNTGERKS